jgi:ankyrin repeat protein
MRAKPIILAACILAVAAAVTFGFGRNFVRNDNLNQAALAGDIHQCDNLLSKGANVNGAGTHAMKPIMSAAKDAHLETVKYLVSRGADVNAHNDSGSALMWAVDSGNEEIVQFLLLSGTNVRWTNALGETALDFARTKKANNMIRILETWPKKAEPDGAANRSQPVSSETNRTSAAAGSGR